jgi:hypothetical protein
MQVIPATFIVFWSRFINLHEKENSKYYSHDLHPRRLAGWGNQCHLREDKKKIDMHPIRVHPTTRGFRKRSLRPRQKRNPTIARLLSTQPTKPANSTKIQIRIGKDSI